MVDEFDSLSENIIINDSQALQSLANLSTAALDTKEKIAALQALADNFAKGLGISTDAAIVKLKALNAELANASGFGKAGGGTGNLGGGLNLGVDPALFNQLTPSVNATTQAFNSNTMALGNMATAVKDASWATRALNNAHRDVTPAIQTSTQAVQQSVPAWQNILNSYNTLGSYNSKFSAAKAAIQDYSNTMGVSLEKATNALIKTGNAQGSFTGQTEKTFRAAGVAVERESQGIGASLTKLGNVFYHVWTAMLAFQVVQWAMNFVQGIGTATKAAQDFYKSLVNIEMGIRAMQGAGIDVTMKDATKAINDLTTLFPVISKPAMTDAFDNVILKTSQMGLSWKQVTAIMTVAAGTYAQTGKSMESVSDAIVNTMVSSTGNMTKTLLEQTNIQVNSADIVRKAKELEYLAAGEGVSALTKEERAWSALLVVLDQFATKQPDIVASMESVPAKIDAVNKAFETWRTNIGLLFLEIKANFAPQILELINLLEWLTDVAKNTFIFQKTAGEIAMGAVTKVESTRSGFSPEELLRMNPRFSEYKDIDKTTEAWRQYTTALEKAIATGKLMGISGKLPNEIVATQMKIMNSEGGEYGKLYAQEFTKALAETIANEGYESAFGSGVVIGEAIVAGLEEDQYLVAAKATATEILKLKLDGLDEAQQAELDIAQDTANEILAIKDRALTEDESKALDSAIKSSNAVIKAWDEAWGKRLMERADWEENFSGLKTGAERATAVMNLLKAGLEGMGAAGVLVWDSLLQGMGEIGPAAIEAYIQIQTLLSNIQKGIDANVAPNLIAGWAQAWIEGIQNSSAVGLSTALGEWIKKGIKGIGTDADVSAWVTGEGTEAESWLFQNQNPNAPAMATLDTSKMSTSMDELITKSGNLNVAQETFINTYIKDTQTFVGQTQLRVAAEQVYKDIYDSYISKTITITTIHNDVFQGTPPGVGGSAGGADFIVPPGFPNDSFTMRVQSGEHVVVTPAGLGGAVGYNPGYGGITTAPSGAKGSGGDVSIVVYNPIPRAAEDSIHREYISINYLGIT